MEIVYQVYIIYKHKMYLKKNKDSRLLKKVFERFYSGNAVEMKNLRKSL